MLCAQLVVYNIHYFDIKYLGYVAINTNLGFVNEKIISW